MQNSENYFSCQHLKFLRFHIKIGISSFFWKNIKIWQQWAVLLRGRGAGSASASPREMSPSCLRHSCSQLGLRRHGHFQASGSHFLLQNPFCVSLPWDHLNNPVRWVGPGGWDPLHRRRGEAKGGSRICLRSKSTVTWVNQITAPFPQHPLHLFLSEVTSLVQFRCSWLCASIKELDLALFGFPVLFLAELFNGQTLCFIYLTEFLHIVSGYHPSPADHITACAGVWPSVGFTLNQILIVTPVINWEELEAPQPGYLFSTSVDHVLYSWAFLSGLYPSSLGCIQELKPKAP